MEEIYHIPAMLKETIEGLAIKPNGVYVDVTFGGGGHSRAILNNLTPTLSTREGDEPLPNPPHEGEGSRIPSGTTDEINNGDTKEDVNGGTKGDERNEGHLYSFDQDIEAYENVRKIQTPPQPSPQGEGSRIPSGGMDKKKKEEQPHPNPPHEGEGSRMSSGTMDEINNGDTKEDVNGGTKGDGQNEGHLYSFDQDIEAYENVRKIQTPPQPSPQGEGSRIPSGGMDKKKKEEQPHPNPPHEGEGSRIPSGTMNDAGFVNDPRWTFVHSNFRYLRNWMDYYGVKEIDGLLADLGVSFHHFDCPERGFSFRFSAPLDMRMNQTAKRTAADIVNGYSEEELAKIFWLYGEMKNGRGIARNICKARSQKPILRTEELIEAALNLPLAKLAGTEHREAQGEGSRMTSGIMDDEKNTGQKTREQNEGKAGIIELDIPAQYKKDLARLFQALRIEVNDEMGALREMLVAARDLVKPGGRIAILTYHSLEDRLVKNFFRSGNLEGTIEKDFYGNAITPFDVIEKGRVASDDEVERNPRSRSAKLRVAERK